MDTKQPEMFTMSTLLFNIIFFFDVITYVVTFVLFSNSKNRPIQLRDFKCPRVSVASPSLCANHFKDQYCKNCQEEHI